MKTLYPLTMDRFDAKYIKELARLESAIARLADADVNWKTDKLDLNPTLEVLQLEWRNLPGILSGTADMDKPEPSPGKEIVLVWKNPIDSQVKFRPAGDEDLLVMKIVVEGLTSVQAADKGGVSVSAIDAAIDNAIRQGVLISPPSLLRREPSIIPHSKAFDESFYEATSFTLQWHITQNCDLHCKHCYDRSGRPEITREKGFSILDDLHDFCSTKHVKGRVSFSGGNPLMYPHFDDLYRAAVDHGFDVSVLGNPTTRSRIEKLVAIRRPDFFQVSLEGLREHNDSIRGAGHFERTVEFLKILKELDIYSMVMLTLTRDNIDQVLALGDYLRDIADTFNFNRLSMVGEGAALKLPERKRFAEFLEEYLEASRTNPVLGIKDNFFNIILQRQKEEPFGGCTGFGCGAAFNFLALLADGEVHACRKFPSLIGNMYTQSLTQIYESGMAVRYRTGCRACIECPIRPGCGGCLASAYSHGLDIFDKKDPFCFFGSSQ